MDQNGTESLQQLLRTVEGGVLPDLLTQLQTDSYPEEVCSSALITVIKTWKSGYSLECVQELVTHVDVGRIEDVDGQPLILLVVQQYHSGLLELLLQAGCPVQGLDQVHRTALHIAVNGPEHDESQIVKLLLDAGLSSCVQDSQGDTPLHLAARNGLLESLSILMDSNCDLNHQNRDGDTPLHLAVRFKRNKCVEVLVANGANSGMLNYNRKSPKQEASGSTLAAIKNGEKPENRPDGKPVTRRWEEAKPNSPQIWHRSAKTSSSSQGPATSFVSQRNSRPEHSPFLGMKNKDQVSDLHEDRRHISLEKQLENERKLKETALENVSTLEKSLAKVNSELLVLKEKLADLKGNEEVKFLFPRLLVNQEDVYPLLQLDMETFVAEVKVWQSQCQAVYQKAIRQIRTEVQSLWPNSDLEEYGSFANNLHLPSSDIDLVIVNAGTINSLLPELSHVLRQKPGVTTTSLVASAFIPVLKVQMRLDSVDIRIDITQQDPRHTGVKCSLIVKQKMEEIPRLREVNLAVKHLFQWCDFTEPFKGGLSSYGIFLMVLNFFQTQMPACEEKYGLAAPLHQFLNFYAWNFNYHDAICVREAQYDPTYFPPALDPYLVIVDPISPTRNVGHNTNLEAMLVLST